MEGPEFRASVKQELINKLKANGIFAAHHQWWRAD